MGIRIEPTGMAGLYGAAAKLAGEAIGAQKVAEQSRRTAEHLRDIQARQQLAEFQRDLELQREQRSMVRQLEKEERAYQWGMEEEERAHQWEMEKMELRSRADFAERETKRQEKRREFDNYLKKLDETDIISDEKKEKLALQAEAKFAGVSFSDRFFPELYGKEVDPIKAAIYKQIGLQAGGIPTRAELEANPSEASFQKGVELGYWEGDETITNPVTGMPIVGETIKKPKKSSYDMTRLQAAGW